MGGPQGSLRRMKAHQDPLKGPVGSPLATEPGPGSSDSLCSHSQSQGMMLPLSFPSQPKLQSNFANTPMPWDMPFLMPETQSSLCHRHLALNKPQAGSHCMWEANTPPSPSTHPPPQPPSPELSSLSPTAVSGHFTPTGPLLCSCTAPWHTVRGGTRQAGASPSPFPPLMYPFKKRRAILWGNLPIPALAQLTHWFSLCPARSCALALPFGSPRGPITPGYTGSSVGQVPSRSQVCVS